VSVSSFPIPPNKVKPLLRAGVGSREPSRTRSPTLPLFFPSGKGVNGSHNNN